MPTDPIAAAVAVVKAWNDPGPHPSHHERVKRELRTVWPALYVAVEQLAAASENREPNL